MDLQEYLTARSKAEERERELLFEKAKHLENEDRRYFSQTREGYEVLGRDDLSQHPHPSLIPLFASATETALEAFRIDPPGSDDGDINKRIFCLTPDHRASLTGQQSIVPTLDEFKSNFLDVFCEGSLRYLNWENIFAAGGGVLACTQPIPAEYAMNVATKRKYFHDVQYSSSDVDLFLYGLNEEDGKRKLLEIYEAVCQACPHTVVCFRSAHAVTLVSQYPFRHIQIVLRLYSSPYEVLAGFDVDSCTVGFDGHMVYADARAHHALVTRRNTIDVTRRSPSYEMRLAKYGERGFEIQLTNLNRANVDPGIFERPWRSLEGLAKLLVLERLRTPTQRNQFFEMQKLMREGGLAESKPLYQYFSARRRSRMNRKFYGRDEDKVQERLEEKLGGAAEVSNYSTIFLPWAPDITAETTMRLMVKKDKLLNSKFFMKTRKYRLHPCFFGSAEEILADCCPDDPPFPPKVDPEEPVLREHRETYVRGPLTFIMDDPGRQRIGSFHPMSEEGWSEGVYFHETTEALFAAVIANDSSKVEAALLSASSVDVRDFFGRTALHLALMAGVMNSVETLLRVGGSPLEPMAGGRTVFHLASMYNRPGIIQRLKAATEEYLNQKFQKEQPWDKKMDVEQYQADIQKKARNSAKALVRARDLDARMSPLQMALTFGHLDCVKELFKIGATVLSDPPNGKEDEPYPMFSVSLIHGDFLEESIKLLVANDYSCATVVNPHQQMSACTDLLYLISIQDEKAIEALSRLDPSFKEACEICSIDAELPMQMAVNKENSTIVEILMKAGCPMTRTRELVDKTMTQLKNPGWHMKSFTEGAEWTYHFALRRAMTRFALYCQDLSMEHQLVENYVTQPVRTRKSLREFLRSEDEYQGEDYLQQLSIEKLRERALDSLKILKLISSKVDFETLSPCFNMHQVIYAQELGTSLTMEYWMQKSTITKNKDVQPLLTFSNFSAQVLGTMLKYLEALEADTIQIDCDLKDQLSMDALLQALDNLLQQVNGEDMPHVMEVLQGWRTKMIYENAETLELRSRGIKPSIMKELHEIRKRDIPLLKERVKELARIYKCDEEELNYFKQTADKSNRWKYKETATAKFSGQNKGPFPTTASLFQNFPTGSKLQAYFEEKEKQYPLPSNVDTIENRWSCNEPWLVAAFERSIFRLSARLYAPMNDHKLRPSYYGNYNNNLQLDSFGTGGIRFTGNPEIQAKYFEFFSKLRKGETFDVESYVNEHQIVVASSDSDMRTPLVMAILAGNIEMIKPIIDCAITQHDRKKLLEAKGLKKTKPTEKINNLELLEEENDASDYSEDDDGEDSPEEGSDEGEEEEEVPSKSKSVKKLPVSMTKAFDLFRTPCSIYLPDSDLPTQFLSELKAFQEEYLTRFPLAANGWLLAKSIRVTPIQLAIVLDNPKMLETLLDLAGQFSSKLVAAVVMHPVPTWTHASGITATVFQLALSMDRLECLRVLITKAGFGENYRSVAELFGMPGWNWKFDTGSSEQKGSKKGEGNPPDGQKTRYDGLESSMYGAKKVETESQRNPIIFRLKRLPHPASTLLHQAAICGSSRCYQYLTNHDGQLLEDITTYLRLPGASCIRELLASIRTRAPKAFALKFGSEISLKADAAIAMYYRFGGDESNADSFNCTPLHYAIMKNKLADLLTSGLVKIPRVLIKEHNVGQVSVEEKIRFPSIEETSIGSFYMGGSLLILASYLGHKDECELLMDAGYDPVSVDEHYFGFTPLEAAIDAKEWNTALTIAKRLKPEDLLKPSAHGITPLMVIARRAPVDKLIQLLDIVVPGDNKGQEMLSNVDVLTAKSEEGVSALHLASHSRNCEAVKVILDWLSKVTPTFSWLQEDCSTGRTPLDCGIAAVLAKRHATVRLHSDFSVKKPLKLIDSFHEASELVPLLTSTASQSTEKRIRASFQQVQPVRKRLLENLTKSSEDPRDNELASERDDYQYVFPASLSIQVASMKKDFYSAKDSVLNAFDMLSMVPVLDIIDSVW